MLANEEIDIVDICLPTFLHAEYAIKAMEKVKYLFVEKENDEDVSGTFGGLSTSDLIIFEDSAYVMARHANPDIEQQTPDDWLDTFNMFDIFDILPEIMDLWNLNNATTSEPKKK